MDDQLLALLPPTALAAIEYALRDAAHTQPKTEEGNANFLMLLRMSRQASKQGESIWGEDYAYLAGSVAESLAAMTKYIY